MACKCKYEKYLDILNPFSAQKLINFRMCNNHLPIEKLRWSNVDRVDRLCIACNSGEIGDEYHYIFNCLHFKNIRKQLVPEKYLKHKNCISFQSLMNETDEGILFKLSKFLSAILKCFLSPVLQNNDRL